WLLSDHDELFLVDWEGAMIADPAIDLGMLLYNYVPENKWAQWLRDYGTKDSIGLQKRMKWYTVGQSIGMVQWNEDEKGNKDIYRNWFWHGSIYYNACCAKTRN